MAGLSPANWLTDIFPWPWLQIPGLIVVIGLVIGFIVYRRRQM